MRWIGQAAEAGEPEAMRRLGLRYLHGSGVPKDPAEGVRWSRRAADAGHVNAMLELVRCYTSGLGVEGNDAEALRWTRKAASMGSTAALVWMADRYKKGQGVERNVAVAREIYTGLANSPVWHTAEAGRRYLSELDGPRSRQSRGGEVIGAAIVVGILAALLAPDGSSESAPRASSSSEYMKKYLEETQRELACLSRGGTYLWGFGCS